MKPLEQTYFSPKSLKFPEIGLYLDAHRPRPWSFISHAHADHFARHEKILCSTATGYLLEKRFGVDKTSIQSLDWGEKLELKGYEIELFPAGHIMGSAMIRLSYQGSSVLYTGDFKRRGSLSAETPLFPKANIMVMETTFGLPKYVFPDASLIQQQLLNFVDGAIADGEIPILFGYSLGKAQEAHAILQAANIPVVLHKAVYDMSIAYREVGKFHFPEIIKVGKEIPNGHVFIAPPNAVKSRFIRVMKNKRTAMLSGWALNPSAQYRYQTDEVICLSDHADYPDLIKAVEIVQPDLVYTLHGSTREFAADLRNRGIDAWSIYGDDQLDLLKLEMETHRKNEIPRPDSDFKAFSQLLEMISLQGSKLKKIELLAGYFKDLQVEDLRIVVNWIRETRSHRIGPSIIKQSLLMATGLSIADYKNISAQQNDSARTARVLLESSKISLIPEALTLKDIFGKISTINANQVQLEKVKLLSELIQHCHPKEGESVIRVAGGGIRAGVKDGLIEEALAKAFQRSIKALRRAHMLTGSLAKTAILAKNDALQDAKLQAGTAIKPMLASAANTSEKILDWHKQLDTDAKLWVEEKHDGIRAQLHVTPKGAELFSRDLKRLGEQFPELIKAAKGLTECIIDGEIIAFDPENSSRKLGFSDLQRRLGKKKLNMQQGDLFGGPITPVSFIAFDCMWSSSWTGNKMLFEQALKERRQALENLGLTFPFCCIEVQRIPSHNESILSEAFRKALAAGNEGLMVKDETSSYMPGSRGKNWMKLKGVMPSLDCVVIAAQQGHGKRAGVLSDYTFAIRQDESGDLVTLGKAYSGLSDEEIEELTVHFQRNAIGKANRKVIEVKPDIVLEIAFDRISHSKRHNSGLALRFPRIKGIRRDKTVDDIDSMSTALALVNS